MRVSGCDGENAVAKVSVGDNVGVTAVLFTTVAEANLLLLGHF